MKGDPRGGRITTREEATALVRMYCQRAIEARDHCHQLGLLEKSTTDPFQKEATINEENKAYQHWLMSYGSAIGALVSMHRTGLIPENTYELLQAEVFATLQPKVVGIVNNPVPPSGGVVLA